MLDCRKIQIIIIINKKIRLYIKTVTLMREVRSCYENFKLNYEKLLFF